MFGLKIRNIWKFYKESKWDSSRNFFIQILSKSMVYKKIYNLIFTGILFLFNFNLYFNILVMVSNLYFKMMFLLHVNFKNIYFNPYLKK